MSTGQLLLGVVYTAVGKLYLLVKNSVQGKRMGPNFKTGGGGTLGSAWAECL